MSAPRRLHARATQPRHAAARLPRSAQRTVALLAVGVVALSAIAVAAMQSLTDMLGNDVPRVPDAFAGLDASSRPPTAGGLTFLLVGTDTRSDTPTTGAAVNASTASRS